MEIGLTYSYRCRLGTCRCDLCAVVFCLGGWEVKFDVQLQVWLSSCLCDLCAVVFSLGGKSGVGSKV